MQQGSLQLFPICVSLVSTISSICEQHVSDCQSCEINIATNVLVCHCSGAVLTTQFNSCVCQRNLQTHDLSCSCTNANEIITFTTCSTLSGGIGTCPSPIMAQCTQPIDNSCNSNCNCVCVVDGIKQTTSCYCVSPKKHDLKSLTGCSCYVNGADGTQSCSCADQALLNSCCANVHHTSNNNNNKGNHASNNNNNQNTGSCGAGTNKMRMIQELLTRP